MWLLILLGFLQLVQGPENHTENVQQALSQAEYYIQQIEEGQNTDENLWALTLIASENETVKTFVEQKVREKGLNGGALSLFHSIEDSAAEQLQKVVFETGSSNLLIALLLQDIPDKRQLYEEFTSIHTFPDDFSNVDYQNLSNTIIASERVTTDMLPVKPFHLPHFFLLSHPDRSRYLSDSYIAQLADEWQNNRSVINRRGPQLPAFTLMQALYLLDRYSQITPLYNTLANDQWFPASSLKLRIYRYFDYAMYRTGYFDRNLTITRNFLLPLTEYTEDKEAELSVRTLLGVYLYSIGRLQRAKEVYTQVLEEANNNNIPINRSSLYNNLGITYLKLGEYDRYLDLQFQALETARKQENYSHQLEIYNNLFVYYKQTNDLSNALSYIEQAEKLADELGTPTDLGKIYTFLGSFYRDFQNNFEKAHEYFVDAGKALDPENDSRYYIYFLNEQSQTFEKQQQFEHALKGYNRIIELTPQEENPNYIDAVVNKAKIHLKQQKVSKAETLVEKFSQLDLSKLNFEQLVKANTVRAQLLHKKDQSEEALAILTPTIEQVVERAQSSTDLQSGFWHVADEYIDAFELTASIYMDNGQPAQAVNLLDRLKTINDASIYQNPLIRASLLNESELTQYKNITSQLDAKRKRLLTLPQDEQFQVQQEINELNLQKRKFDRKISSQSEVQPISIPEVQRKLSAHQLVLHITELKDQYYVARITRSDVSIDVIPLDEEKRRLFETNVEQLADNTTNLDSLYAVSQLLNIDELPSRIEEITIIPDSYLYQLPVDVLPIEKPAHKFSYGESRYAVERFDIHYLTSLNDFKTKAQNNTDSTHEWNYIGYGVSNFDGFPDKSLVPLPFAETEVNTIKDRLTHLKNLKTYTNNASQKETFTQSAQNGKILHLATHSEVSERDPLFSTIYMANNSTETDSTFNNQLFAYELFELNLNNELIMLNSCKSGSGPYIRGSGIMGFSRALQYAGAQSLVLNIWSVNDMLASDFAIHFYSQLNEGKSKSEALRATKRYFLETKNASPHLWGPYMLIGDTDPIVHPDRRTNLAVAGSFLLYFLIIIILTLFKEKGILFQSSNGSASV